MFSQTFVHTSGSARPWPLLFSFTIQAAGVGLLLAVPLMFLDSLPAVRSRMSLELPPPAAPAAAQRANITRKVAVRQFDGRRLSAPIEIPREISPVVEDALPSTFADERAGFARAIPNPGGLLFGSILEKLASPPPAAKPPQPRTPPAPAKPVPVSSGVQAANLIHKVVPVYPALARTARISGAVRFTAIIGTDGRIQNLKLISGHPLLVDAARQAVQQWIYRPTLLSGSPVEVITQIDVNFTMA